MPEVNERKHFTTNEDKEAALSPLLPQHHEPNIAKLGGRPSALQRLAALAAAIAAQDRDEDDSDSDSDSDESDTDSCDSDYWSLDIPFRTRRASTPAAIGGQHMIEAAQAAMRRLLIQRMVRRSTFSINAAKYF